MRAILSKVFVETSFCICLVAAAAISPACVAQTEDVKQYRDAFREYLLEEEQSKATERHSRGLRAVEELPKLDKSRLKMMLQGDQKSIDRPGEIVLDIQYATVRIGKDDVKLRTYNGKLVGPIIRAKAGETIFITLRNKLPVEPELGHGQNTHHMWNSTNLHFHGLHVAPQGPVGVPDEESDNVLLELKPVSDPEGSVQKYAVKIPADHVAGTFWYHAHRHGATAGQVASGMCGALIIERTDATHNLDSIPEVAAAGEEIMVLQQIPYLKPAGSAVGFVERSSNPTSLNNDWAAQMLSPGRWYGAGTNLGLRRYTSVNGQLFPEITLRPGEVRRLRFIHSGQREELRMGIERAPGDSGPGQATLSFHEIAADGLPLGNVRERNALSLFPGYRSDVLIQASRDTQGVFWLVDQNARNSNGADTSPEPLKLIAKIRVTGSPVSMQLPTDAQVAPHRLTDIQAAEVESTQHAFYGIVTSPSLKFFISRDSLAPGQVPTGFEFDSTRIRPLIAGKTERWIVGTRNSRQSGPTSPFIQQYHPFHIHINPFLVEHVFDSAGNEVTTSEIGGTTWRDTLVMKQGYTYHLLTRYDDFTGDFVNHCHILDHEDSGMMEIVRISNSTPSPTPVAIQAAPAPAEESTRKAQSDSRAPAGKPSVLFFVQGSFCPHCMTQLDEMAKTLSSSDIAVSVVSASTAEDLKQFPNVPFQLIPDPEYKLFKQYGAFDKQPKHATFVFNRQGRETLRKVGEEPFMESSTILAATKEQTPRLVIAVRGTEDASDDYLTWAPSRCQVRLENGNAGGPDISVTISNEPPAPNVGTLAFDNTVAPGQTATKETITVTVKQDGTPTEFFVAGKTRSQLTRTIGSLEVRNAGRDSAIVARSPGISDARAEVMVRVRTDASKLNAVERAEYLETLAKVKASGRYEQLVLLHTIAAGHEPGNNWPDQAHGGPGFLPWHRAFLLGYERTLQKVKPYLALHYWREDLPSTVFQKDFLGENDVRPDESPVKVQFDAANPLLGWEINGVFLERFAKNRTVLTDFKKESDVLQWPDFRTPPDGDNFSASLENNPHNVGHGWVGPWMSNPRRSPRDPVFFLFHSDDDRLWAKWQWTHGRFGTKGTNESDYTPTGKFAPGTSVTLGHHLEDTMWPWDNKNGPQGGGFPGNRPPVFASDNSFPASNVNGIWPGTVPGIPTVATMIDYLGIDGTGIDLGFCYDDVPFGVKPVTPVPTPEAAGELSRVAGDPQQPWAKRLQSLKDLRGRASAEHKQRVLTIAQNENESDELRVAAFTTLSSGDFDWVTPAIAIVRKQSEAGSTLQTHLVKQLGVETRSTKRGHDRKGDVHAALRSVMVDEQAPVASRLSTLETLASENDEQAIQILKSAVAETRPTYIPKETAVSLLAASLPGENLELFRALLGRETGTDARIAALLSLGKDRPSASQRIAIAKSREESYKVREAALRSLLHDNDLIEVAITIVADKTETSAMRSLAASAIGLNILYNSQRLTAQQLRDVQARLSAIDSIESELGTAINQTVQRANRALDELSRQ